METVRESWTDERLDHLNYKVDVLAERVDELGRRMDEGFKELRGEIGAMQRTMVQFASVMVAALMGVFAAQIGLIVSQL